MSNSIITGKCKISISRVMAPFDGMPEKLAKERQKEYKIEVGEIARFYSDIPDEYYFYLNHKKINMNREELEKHFSVVWEKGCYNTCIREGKSCNKIGHHIPEGTSDRDKYYSNCCKIGWEIGRAACSMYES